MQSGLTANFPHMLDEQSQHIAYVIAEARKRKARTLEPTLDAEDAWVEEVVKAALGRQTFLAECTPGYYNNEGVFDPIAARNSQYWRGPVAFLRLLDKWRKEGNLDGLELTQGPRRAALRFRLQRHDPGSIRRDAALRHRRRSHRAGALAGRRNGRLRRARP